MSHGYDERNCGGAVRVNCGTEQVPMASEGCHSSIRIAIDTMQA